MRVCFNILILVLVVITSFGIFSGCINNEDTRLHTEYFYYSMATIDDNPHHITIMGLTDAGKQQKILVIPEEINGVAVNNIKCYFGDASCEKVYFPKNIKIYWHQIGVGNRVKFIFSDSVCPFTIDAKGKYVPIYYSQYAIGYEDKFYGSTIANISYLLNTKEEDGNDGIWFVDDLINGEKITMQPNTPQRDGYRFTGWYFEECCENQLDFKTFTYSEQLGKLTFFAGWEKIK